MINTVADNGTIRLGLVNDNKATVIQFPIANYFSLFGEGGTFYLLNKRPEDANAYAVPSEYVAVQDEILNWTLTNYDVAQPGNGECQLSYYIGDVCKMSQRWRTAIGASLVSTGTVPEPTETWLDELDAIADRAEAAADRAEEAETKTPHIGSNGNWLIWDAVNEQWVDSGTSARPSFVVVGALPAEGQSGIIYLVPSADPGVENIYDEYIWVGTDYELIGTTAIDLSGYVPKTWLDGTDTVNTFQVLSDNGVSIYAETDVHISTPDARVQMSNGGLDIYGIDDVSISSDGTVEIDGYNNTIVHSSGDATVEADGDVTVHSDNGDVALSGNHATFNGKNLLTEQEDTGITDTTPYNLRAETINAIAKKPTFVGATVAWNQLITDATKTSVSNEITATLTNGEWVFSGTANSASTINFATQLNIPGHKILVCEDAAIIGLRWCVRDETNSTNLSFPAINTALGNKVLSVPANCTNLHFYAIITSGTTFSDKAVIQFYDLTTMLGSTIADYIYGLGDTNGTAWFRSLFPSATYAYNAGTLYSVNPDKSITKSADQSETSTYELNHPTLNGLFKLDAGNNLYADGDTYEHDGTITRKYANVDLGDLTYTYSGAFFYSSGIASIVKRPATSSDLPNIIALGYTTVTPVQFNAATTGVITINESNGQVRIKNTGYTDANAFKTAMAGRKLVYELATPTTESGTAFTETETVYPGGTEALSDYAYEQGQRDVAIPVGHSTVYLRKMIMVPAPPVLNGTYTLTATVNNGSTVIDWQ